MAKPQTDASTIHAHVVLMLLVLEQFNHAALAICFLFVDVTVMIIVQALLHLTAK